MERPTPRELSRFTKAELLFELRQTYDEIEALRDDLAEAREDCEALSEGWHGGWGGLSNERMTMST